MKQIYYWILIALAIGAMAGLITAIFSRHNKKNKAGETAEEDTLSEIEGSRGGNIIFVIMVFAILAFIVIWLIFAVTGRSF